MGESREESDGTGNLVTHKLGKEEINLDSCSRGVHSGVERHEA